MKPSVKPPTNAECTKYAVAVTKQQLGHIAALPFMAILSWFTYLILTSIHLHRLPLIVFAVGFIFMATYSIAYLLILTIEWLRCKLIPAERFEQAEVPRRQSRTLHTNAVEYAIATISEKLGPISTLPYMLSLTGLINLMVLIMNTGLFQTVGTKEMMAWIGMLIVALWYTSTYTVMLIGAYIRHRLAFRQVAMAARKQKA